MIRKLTTVVVVDAIEPVLAHWAALGFERTSGVPHGDRLGFVILAGPNGQELMLQTRDSVRDDLRIEPPAVMLYAAVASLEEAQAATASAEVVIGQRSTFYGTTERWVRDASGTLLCLSVHQK